ncbi:hypothetical protein AMTRI_Chr08g207900 [Amborella trichopoda]
MPTPSSSSAMSTPKLQTWRIVPDPEKPRNWTFNGPESRPIPAQITTLVPQNCGLSLPSFADLLVQRSSTLLGGTNGNRRDRFSCIHGQENAQPDFTSGASLFRSGHGKPVGVAESSIRKAMAVLGGDDDQFEHSKAKHFVMDRGSSILFGGTNSNRKDGFSCIQDQENDQLDFTSGAPLFRSGHGKPVGVAESSIRKAMAVLGEGDDDQFEVSKAKHFVMDRGSTTFSRGINNNHSERLSGTGYRQNQRSVLSAGAPMFTTGSGKPVGIAESSIRRAMSVLGEGDGTQLEVSKAKLLVVDKGSSTSFGVFNYNDRFSGIQDREYQQLDVSSGAPMFRTGSGKPVGVAESSIKRALSILGEEGGSQFEVSKEKHLVMHRGPVPKSKLDCSSSISEPVFKTGSGKVVHVSSTGLLKAKALLGLEEHWDNPHNFQHFKNGMIMRGSNLQDGRHNSRHSEKFSSRAPEIINIENVGLGGNTMVSSKSQAPCQRKGILLGNQLEEETSANPLVSKISDSGLKVPPIRFQTAGGRSISISSDALERAKSLLGESDFRNPLCKENSDNTFFSFSKEVDYCDKTVLGRKDSSFGHVFQDTVLGEDLEAKDQSLLEALSNLNQSHIPLKTINFGLDLQQHVAPSNDIPGGILRSKNDSSSSNGSSTWQSDYNGVNDENYARIDVSQGKFLVPRKLSKGEFSSGPLVDISNNIHADCNDHPQRSLSKPVSGDKRRLGGKNIISPFKRPRRSKFLPPLNSNIHIQAPGPRLPDCSTLPAQVYDSHKTNIRSCYPFQHKRKTLEEFFGGPPSHWTLEGSNLPEKVKFMTADSAQNYLFNAAPGSEGNGVEMLHNMLVQAGGSLQHATKKWVSNHYKWIVWKLACLEKGYPGNANGKYLTVANVLEELKYRYEREVNQGHRSALKKILEGSASVTSPMILCVSAIRSNIADDSNVADGPDRVEDPSVASKSHKFSYSHNTNDGRALKVELTDGWYSLNAVLDVPLSKQLRAGKLFVGQKLRIWGASLCNWVGPLSPLEISETVSLLIHMNGTYRAHWASRLGFCRGNRFPLAFHCIKDAGGPVPMTLVGVTRVYPILYKERLNQGGSIVRSERMETKSLQLYNQRRTIIAESVVSEAHKDNFGILNVHASDLDEGEEIFKMFEKSAEPESLMATMNSEQLGALAAYQAKQEAIRQSEIQKKVEKALEEADLNSRKVTPFMKVKVVGLINNASQKRTHPREGLITVWQPTEKQEVEIEEGQMYCVSGLTPLRNSISNIIHLHGRGSATVWHHLKSSVNVHFEPFFTPRESILLSTLGQIPLASEFDFAGVVVFVGEPYVCGNHKKQWVFTTDGSEAWSGSESDVLAQALLAISFSMPIADTGSFAPANYTLAGSTVGFCNLLKRERDQSNNLWVAEATENSTYSFCFNLPGRSHLKESADNVRQWAKNSSLILDKLKQRILHIIGI